MEFGRYRRGRFIGSGASGDVYEGVDTSTGEMVAIQSVDCRRFRCITELEAAQAEASLLSALRHRHIVRLHAVHFHPTAIHFVMEYASGGTLAQLLRSREGLRLGEAEVLQVFVQIFQALEFCHRRCVVHRDLKPENILLDARGAVKVADFGLAGLLTPFDGDVASLVGTPEFMAPDLLVSASCDGAKADVWSLGVMLFEALAGRTPFVGPSLPAILRAALRGERPPLPAEVGQQCRDLVDALLQADPAKRITLEEVLEHPWVLPAMERGHPTALPSSDSSEGEAEEDSSRGADAELAGNLLLPAAGSLCGLGMQPMGSPVAASRPGSGRGAGLCRSSPAGLTPGLSLQRASSLTLVLPGAEAGQGVEGLDSGGRLPTVAEEKDKEHAGRRGGGSSRKAALLRSASLAAGRSPASSCMPARSRSGGSAQRPPRSPQVPQQGFLRSPPARRGQLAPTN